MNEHDDSPGFTIIEMVIAAATLLVLSMMVTQLTISGQDAHQYSIRLGRITEISQRAIDGIKQDVRAAVRVFGNDALGLAYRSHLEPWSGFDPIGSTTLPSIQSAVGFGKDVFGSEKTGNELLFARHAWADVFQCNSGKSYRVDIYRVERLYLRVEGSGPNTPSGALNVCKWTSEPMASAAQIDLIADPTDRTEVLLHLHNATPDAVGDEHDAVYVVWKFAENPALTGTFRQILTDGWLSDTPLAPRSATWQIEQSDQLSNPGLFFTNQHSVAANDSPLVHGLSRFAIRDDSAGMGSGFPHGLEFQVVGSSAARKILIHLTTISKNQHGLTAQFDIQVIVSVREG